ncbi:MAG: OadG family protein [Bacteroidales bacterium]|nr:OadG family protein [Bacteroidales bacterium]
MKRYILFASSLIVTALAMAQGAHDFKINEVSVSVPLCCQMQAEADSAAVCCDAGPVEGYRDEYGDMPSWIEIVNTSYSTHDIRSCYLTTNRAVLNKDLSAHERIEMMSLIPKGDARTNLEAKQRIVFFADGKINRGTLHTNFTLTPGEENWIALYDGNGVDLLDSLTVPVLESGHSYARIYNKEQDAFVWIDATPDQVTPDAPNEFGENTDDKTAEWKKNDPHGVAMAIIAMGIVFGCLILLFVFFYIFGWILNRIAKLKRVQGIKQISEAGEKIVVMAKEGAETKGIEMENYVAAIGLALYEYMGNEHDVESGVLTIEHHATTWESKEHLMRHTPEIHHNH